MVQILKKLSRYKKLLKSGIVETWYVFCRDIFPLKEKSVLLQSRYGDDLGGNIFYILKELSRNYQDYTLYLVYKNKTITKYKALINKYNIKNVHLVELHRAKYWYLLATCKYLINDVTFHTAFIKREGQIYLNTWHGTPLKKMGLEEEESGYLFGNMQRNFLAADYFLCPSQYMTELMVRAYSLNHLFLGEIVNEGYPRNAIFFDEARKNELRKELGLENLQVVVYMPTWRGNSNVNKSEQYTESLKEILDELDKELTASQVFFVKLHPMVSASLDLTKYTHIKSVPGEYETYDFLNTADCLVTDYSSVMFDFACSGRDIILFTYDEEEYLRDRGLYISISNLPFKQAKNAKQVAKALYEEKFNYKTDAFIKGIIEYENKDAARHICDKLLKNAETCTVQKLNDNKKQNVFIYVDMMVKNGITSAAFNLINIIDIGKRNYFFVFRKDGAKENRHRLKEVPEGVGVLSIDSVERTFFELIASYLYYIKNLKNGWIEHYLDRCYKRAFKKYYGNVHKDVFIQFVGYGRDPLHIFLQAEKKYVFVHNDMKKELNKGSVQHKNTLIECYQNYDKVLGVSGATMEIAAEIAGHKGNFGIVHNSFNYIDIEKKSLQNIEYDQDTECISADADEIMAVLNSGGRKIITIGRFSPEKEHKRLLDAFDLYWRDHSDSKLFIIGGYGVEYNRTVDYAKTLSCWEGVYIIKSINNPISILKKCDLFVLSSSHEGLPVVFFEADCLHKPILSTDIDGPHEFLNQYKGGMLVEESAEALYQGMLAFDKGLIKPLNIDMKKYNEQCVQEFENLFT